MRSKFKGCISTLLLLVVLVQYFSPIFVIINVKAMEETNTEESG